MDVGNCGQTSHEVMRDERPQDNRSLAGRDSLAGVPIKVDWDEYHRHLGQFLVAASITQCLVDQEIDFAQRCDSIHRQEGLRHIRYGLADCSTEDIADAIDIVAHPRNQTSVG